jgi:hypothetical protein
MNHNIGFDGAITDTNLELNLKEYYENIKYHKFNGFDYDEKEEIFKYIDTEELYNPKKNYYFLIEIKQETLDKVIYYRNYLMRKINNNKHDYNDGNKRIKNLTCKMVACNIKKFRKYISYFLLIEINKEKKYVIYDYNNIYDDIDIINNKYLYESCKEKIEKGLDIIKK